MPILHVTELFALDGRRFVHECYRSLLNREPDEHGLAYYLGRLSLGFSREEIILQFTQSPEYRPRNDITGLEALISTQLKKRRWYWRFIKLSGHKKRELAIINALDRLNAEIRDEISRLHESRRNHTHGPLAEPSEAYNFHAGATEHASQIAPAITPHDDSAQPRGIAALGQPPVASTRTIDGLEIKTAKIEESWINLPILLPELPTEPGALSSVFSTDDFPRSRVEKRILVADYRVPRPDVSAGERATAGILRDLCALGYEVVFLANDMRPSPSYELPLKEFGVELVAQGPDIPNALHYITTFGKTFDTFYFIRVDVAETLLQAARQASPSARIIFHAPDLYFIRELREAALINDQNAHARALATKARELEVMQQSDSVAVVSPKEALKK